LPIYEYLCSKCGVIEIMHGIAEDARTVCPTCGQKGLERLISRIAGWVWKGREANSYNDILKSKYWRDKNGDLHKVGPGDGRVTSAGVGRRQTASPQEIEFKKKRSDKARKHQRREESYRRYVNRVNRARKP
jgi:putative FmdB family regulatory protein